MKHKTYIQEMIAKAEGLFFENTGKIDISLSMSIRKKYKVSTNK